MTKARTWVLIAVAGCAPMPLPEEAASDSSNRPLAPEAAPPAAPAPGLAPVAAVPAEQAPAEPLAAPSPEPLRATAACADDVIADAAARWPHGAVSASDLTADEIIDLDGDGSPERVVTAAYQGCGASGNCLALVYFSAPHFSTGGCATYVGSIWYREGLEALPTARHGVRDFRIFLTDGCAGRAGVFVTYGFTEHGFSELERITCACPDDDPRPRNPPLCERRLDEGDTADDPP